MSSSVLTIGRARTVLVFGDGDDTRAVISSVVAHTRDNINGDRISFVGPVAFERSTIEHARDVLVPIIDNILDLLGLSKKNFEISVVNPGAVSAYDLGVNISGFSADVPMILAMLSATLNVAISDNIVSTGHIASSDGDIAVVKAMCAKINAAFDDKSVSCFIYSNLEADGSLAVLSPVETENTKVAVIKAKSRLKMMAVNDIADLIRAVFTDEAIVPASLQEGFFGIDCSRQSGGNPISTSVRFLAENNEVRFWSALERYFHAGDNENAKKLLLAWSQFHIASKRYPKEFGRKLIQLLRSLPPGTRKVRIDFPVLPTLECVKLTLFADKSDADDIRLLYNAVEGKTIWTEPAMGTRPKAASDKLENDKDHGLIDSITTQIDSTNLARTVGVPIDTARATYMLNSLTVKTNEQFHEVITAYYLHLQRHVHSVSESIDTNRVKDDAIALLERTFRDKGGITAAINEACDAIHGGMKFILDSMTDQFKTECQTRYIKRVIQEALDPFNRDVQVSFISALLKRLSSHLPAEITTAPPERFVDHYEILVKEYVKSLDKINEIFRRF